MSNLLVPEFEPVLGDSAHTRMLETLNILLPEQPRNAHYPKDPIVFINDILGLKTWYGQDEIVDAVWNNRYTSVASCHGIGKGLALDTPLPTPSGWTTMGSVSVGDELFDELGNVCRVTAVSPINRIDCYRVTFSDGSSLIADRDHLWSVLRFRWRGTHRQSSRDGGSAKRTDWRTKWSAAETLTTPQLAEATETAWGQRDASIPNTMPLSLPDAELPIDPYILGCWLGDGTSSAPQLTSADQEIVAEIERRGWRARKVSAKYRYSLSTDIRGESVSLLRSLGVLGNKHIPMSYLRSSQRQRRDLLAGLLDTDGFVSQGNRVGIDLCNERLANETAELIRSLGYVANVKVGFVYLNEKKITRWRISFTPESSPFLLGRKSSRFSAGESQYSRMTHRMVVSVDPIPSVETRCIAVDSPRKLYLAGEQMIPTHNSTISAAMALAFLHIHENSIVLSTAPTGRQVEHVLWRNIRAMHRKARKPLLGQKPLTLRYDIAEEWYGMGFKPADAETDPTQGFHAEKVLVIIDEAAGAPATLIDGLHAAMTTGGSRFLMIGNPTSVSGPFYDSHHSKRAGYKCIVIGWEDTPNYKAGRTVIDGLITEQWVEEVREKYGEESPYFRSRVNAEWVPTEGVLIPLAQIEAARERTWDDVVGLGEAEIEAGLDVARQGEDKSVLTIRVGPVVVGQWTVPGKQSWETAGATLALLKEHAPQCQEIKVDIVGIGAGVYDVLTRIVEDQGAMLRVVGVNFSKTPHDKEKYSNQRNEAYGLIADRFRTGMIAGSIHEMTQADLSDLRAKYDGRHTQPIIESKDNFKDRVGRSPDYGDSLALAFYTPPLDEERKIGALAFGAAKQKWGRL